MYIKRVLPQKSRDEKKEADVDLNEYVPINTARLPGKSVLRKLDYIYTTF
jgi:hypothetical protein